MDKIKLIMMLARAYNRGILQKGVERDVLDDFYLAGMCDMLKHVEEQSDDMEEKF